MCGKYVKMAPNVLVQVLFFLPLTFVILLSADMWTVESGAGPILELTVVSRMTRQNYYAIAVTWKTYGCSTNTNTI